MSDYEPPEVCTTTTPMARVAHTCDECRREIQPGQRYERVRGLWGGTWTTIKTCLPCASLRDELDDGYGYVYGQLAEVADYAGVPFPPKGGAS